MKEKVVSRRSQLRSIALMAVLMIVTIVVILKDYSVTELLQAVRSVQLFYLLAGIGMMFLYVFCQAMNFYIIMKSLGVSAPFFHCIEYAYIGNYFNAITPGASGGQPAQIYYMNKDKIHIDVSAVSIFLIVFASQIAIVFMGGILALFRFHILAGSAPWFHYMLIAGTIVMLSLTTFLFVLMFSGGTVSFLIDLAFRIGKKIHLVKNPDEIKVQLDLLIISYREKTRIILKHPFLVVKVFFITLLQWISFCMVAYLVYLSFGLTKYDALDIMAGQALINIAVAAIPLPGSVGIAEKSYLNLFGQFYPASELASAMVLSRIINFYLPLIISFLVYAMTHQRVIKIQKKQSR